MEIAAEVWSWVGPKATGTARFGGEPRRHGACIKGSLRKTVPRSPPSQQPSASNRKPPSVARSRNTWVSLPTNGDANSHREPLPAGRYWPNRRSLSAFSVRNGCPLSVCLRNRPGAALGRVSSRDEAIGLILALDEARAREGQMGADQPLPVGGELVEKPQPG